MYLLEDITVYSTQPRFKEYDIYTWMFSNTSYGQKCDIFNKLIHNTFITKSYKDKMVDYYLGLFKNRRLCRKFITKLYLKVRIKNIRKKTFMNEYSLDLETRYKTKKDKIYIHENLKTWWMLSTEFYSYATGCLRMTDLLTPSPNKIKNPYTNNVIDEYQLTFIIKNVIVKLANKISIDSLLYYFIIDGCNNECFIKNRSALLKDIAITNYVNNLPTNAMIEIVEDFFFEVHSPEKYEFVCKQLSDTPDWMSDKISLKRILKNIMMY